MADNDFAVKNGLTVNGSVLVVNTSTGRVGINTSSPDASLQVVGTANVSGALKVGGVITGNGSAVTSVNAIALAGTPLASFALLTGATFSGNVTFQSRIFQSSNGIISAATSNVAARIDSGFFHAASTSTTNGWPVTGATAYNLISATDDNTGNYYAMQFAGSFTDEDHLYYRATNGLGTTAWVRLLHSGNFNSWAPTLTGTGASGTWGISITGNSSYSNTAGSATTATSAASATLATKASTLSRSGGDGAAMTFTYTSTAGQPTYLWGTNDGSSVLAYNPSNFNVNSAVSAGAVTWSGVTSKPDVVINNDVGRTLTDLNVNIIYDSANASFYVDPASTSNINKVIAANVEVSGTITAAGNISTNGNLISSSDIRGKEKIERIENALDKVCKLTGVNFIRISDGEESTGLIAQDVVPILPQAVQVNEDGYLSLAYGNMVGLLVEAIKEIKIELDQIKRDR
jgi:hypothetical protein